MRYLFSILFLAVFSLCLSAQGVVGNAQATYLAADVCGNDAQSQYFIMVVGGPTKYFFIGAPPQVTSACPANNTLKEITAYTGNPALVAALNARTGGCTPNVFVDIMAPPYNGVAFPGNKLMLFSSPNPDISSWPANAFADLCGQGPILVACGNYQGSTPFFYNNNPYDNTCGTYTQVTFSIAGTLQKIQYRPNLLAAQDGAFVGIDPSGIRYGTAVNCSCPGLSCPPAPGIGFLGDLSICAGERTTITASGGNVFSYQWSTGETGASITVGPENTTTYQVTISRPALPQCAWVYSVRVSVFRKPRIGLISMGDNGGVVCYGQTAYLRTVGGQPGQIPFTYQWTPPDPSIVISPDESVILNEETAGRYTITYTYENGCVFEDYLDLNFPVQVPVKTRNNSPVCIGEPVNVQVSNPLPGVNFLWTGPNGFTDTTSGTTIPSPVTGPYQVIVTDANGCTSTGVSNVLINNCIPAFLSVQAATVHTSCGLSNGSALATALGGVSPYVFEWSHLPPGNASNQVNNLPAGFYTVTVTDAEGATATSSVTILGSSLPDLQITATPTTCGNFNGALNSTIQYGTPPYSLDWLDLSGPDEPQNRLGVSPGNYYVTVTDAAGCTNIAQATVDSSLGANATAYLTHILCNGAGLGAIDITVGGGSGPYTFDWQDLSAPPEPEDRSNLSAGTYSLTITAQNSCTATISATITEPPVLSVTNLFGNAVCDLDNGYINLNVSGGTPVYNFDWSDLPGTSNDQNRINLAAGTYSVTVTDANGCSTAIVQTILQTGKPTASVSTTHVACFGNATGAIQLNVTGGVAPYTFNWLDLLSNPEPEDRINIAAGTYFLTITDVNNCSFTGSYTINQPAAVLSVSTTIVHATCGAADGAITLSVAGGTAPFSFNWSDLNSPPEPQDRTNLAAGVYTVTITDANGCTVSAVSTINQPVGGTVTAVLTNLSCYGNFSGQINVSVTGAPAPFTYNWQDISSNPEPEDRNYLSAGTYSVTVTSANGCTTSGAWVLTQPPLFSAFSSTSTNTTCGLSNGSLNGVGTGGVTPYTYDWSSIPGSNDPPVLSEVSSGSYTIIITDNNGCTSSKVLTVGYSSALTINSTVTHTTCGASNGSVILSCTGGGPGQNMEYYYDWAHIPGTSNIQNLIGINSGTYTVTVSTAGACTNSKTVTVNSSTAVGVTTTISQPTCGARNGTITLNVTGATNPTYDWAHIPGTNNPSNLSTLDAGTYTVTVTSSNGCTKSKTATLTQQGAITAINGTVTNNTSSSAPYNGAVSITVTGGISPFTYDWSHIAGTSNPQNATQIAGGTYTVTVTGGLGCTKSKSFTVINTNSPDPGNGGNTVVYANGQDQAIEDGISDTGEAFQADKARIFPNPATNIFNVDIPEKWGTCSVRIYDSSSRMIRQLEGTKLLEVDAGDLASGMYSVEIIPAAFPDNPSVTLPVVIKRQ